MRKPRGSERPARPESPASGQESVWDYPRPPAVEPVALRLRVLVGGETIADTSRGVRVLETSHPPTYYFPAADVRRDLLIADAGRTVCEFKGIAQYWNLSVGSHRVARAAWSYPDPWPGYEMLKNHLAFYAGRVDRCLVGDEEVDAQKSGFYGGWITARVAGPFKGPAGTEGW